MIKTSIDNIDLELKLEEDIFREEAKSSLLRFSQFIMPDYEVNWHHRLLCKYLDEFVFGNSINRLMVSMPPRSGKAVEVNQPVLTTDGWKIMGELAEGDFVFGSDGKPTRIIAISPIWKGRQLYKASTKDGAEVIVDGEHEWYTRLCRKRPIWENRSTEELFKRESPRNPAIPSNKPLIMTFNDEDADLPIDPYMLGTRLGNRESIPEQYLLKASTRQRLALLQGFIDTDGYVDERNSNVEFCSIKKRLAEDVQFLIRSLGISNVSCLEHDAKLYGRYISKRYRVNFLLNKSDTLPRKAVKCSDEANNLKYLRFEKAGKGNTVCIQVDAPDNLFLVGRGLLVTHNSQIVSRHLPAFIFGNYPDTQIIATSYAAELSSRMNRDVQRIITDDRFKMLFPNINLSEKNIRSDAKGSWLRNNEIFEIVGYKGTYRSAGVGGAITGMGSHYSIIDDPVKNMEEALSTTIQNKIYDWYTSTLYTRLEKGGKILLTMTRWHEADLSGKILEAAKASGEKWVTLEFPAIREDLNNQLDPRQLGEPLWPNKYSLEVMNQIKYSVGSRVWSALYQQRPSPDEGNVVKRDWWKFYKQRPMHFDNIAISWDFAFKDSAKSDFTVGQVWGKLGSQYYLLDQVRDRMSFTASVQAMRSLNHKWPQVRMNIVEAKANGEAIIDHLKRDIGGIVPYSPKDSKEARAAAISPQIEAGNVFLPDPEIAPWIHDYMEEWATFPNGKNDDMIDASSQAILKLQTIRYPWSSASESDLEFSMGEEKKRLAEELWGIT